MVGRQGETYQERTKGKDVRTSNIVAAKVGLGICVFLGCIFDPSHWFLYLSNLYWFNFTMFRPLQMRFELLSDPAVWIS